MHCKNTELVWFSGTGTTRRVMQAMKGNLPAPVREVDLLRQPQLQNMALAADTLLVVGMPVYSGRIPAHCLEALGHIKGNGSPAVAVVVYGNREYDDALLELKDILEANGFYLVGAAAFVARHSIFPVVARERPDGDDLAFAAELARNCARKLDTLVSPADAPPLPVKGNKPYREVKPGGLRPSADSAACIQCGACVDICPVKALSIASTIIRDDALCIACGACFDVCPAGVHAYRGDMYEAASAKFAQAFSARREVETLL